jgi:hypothetical protein
MKTDNDMSMSSASSSLTKKPPGSKGGRISSARQGSSSNVKKISNNKNTDDSDEASLVRALCNAAKNKDAARISSLLGYRSKVLFSPSLDEPLLSGSALAMRLIEQHIVFATKIRGRKQAENGKEDEAISTTNSDSDNNDNMTIQQMHLLFQGLLMAPSAYVTPWKAALEIVKYMQRISSTTTTLVASVVNREVDHDGDENDDIGDDSLQLLLPHLQYFLQQQISSWWWEAKRSTTSTTTSFCADGSGSKNLMKKSPIKIRPREGETLSELTPRDWILQLVAVIMEPLLCFPTTPVATAAEATKEDILQPGTTETLSRHQGFSTIPSLLQVLGSVVSVLDGVKQRDSGFALLLDSILNTVFPRHNHLHDHQQQVTPTTMATTNTIIHMDFLLPWIHLATDIALCLRLEDWSCIHATVMHHLLQKQQQQLDAPHSFPRLTLALLDLFCPTTLESSTASRSSISSSTTGATTTVVAAAASGSTPRRGSIVRNSAAAAAPPIHAFELLMTLLTVAGTAAATPIKDSSANETTSHETSLQSAKHPERSSSNSSSSIARSTYDAVERIMENRLVLFSADVVFTLLAWLGQRQGHDMAQSAAAAVTEPPPWICANMLLLILRALQASQHCLNHASTVMVHCRPGADGSHDVDNINENKQDKDPRGEIWQQLLWLPLLGAKLKDAHAPTMMHGNSSRSLVQIPKRKAVTIKCLQEIMEGVTYTGMGRFQRNGESVVSFTAMGRLVCQSLFLSSVIDDDCRPNDARSQCLRLAKERAKAWIDVAMHVLVSQLLSKEKAKATAATLTHDEYVALPLIVMIAIHCEMSCCRTLLVKDIIRTLDATIYNNATAQTVTTVHILVASAVLRSTYGNGAQCRILNQLANVYKMNLAHSLFLGLAKALLPLQSAPSSLFTSATIRLRSPFSFQRRTVDDDQGRDGREISDSVKCGLLSLCILVCMPADADAPSNKIQAVAWKFLAGIIVHDWPPLPEAAHAWLFRHLRRLCLERDIVDTRTIRRLLRACLIRLLRSFGNQGLSPEGLFACSGKCGALEDHHGRQVVDIYSLTMLSFSLLEQDLRSEVPNGAGENNAMEMFRSELFKVLSDWRKEAEQFHLPAAATALRLVVPSMGADTGGHIVHQAAFRVLAVLFQFMLGVPVAVECSRIPSSSIELSNMLRNLDDDVIKNSDMAPFVVGPSNQTPCTQPVDNGWEKDLRLRLCEHFFFFLTHDVSESKRCRPEVLKWDALSLSALSALEQSLAEESTGDGMLDEHDTDTDALYSSFHGFCEIAVPALKNLILGRAPVAEVDEIISAVLSMCCSIERGLESSSMVDGLFCAQRLLHGILSVYDRLCTESSVVVFIDYMEKQCFGNEEVAKQGSSLADIPIESLDDLDSAVRNVRLIVLRATQGCLQAILREPFRCETNTLDKSEAGSRGDQFSCLIKTIGMLSRDLQVGLDGKSGSVTSEMYLAFVQCIEFASHALSPQCSTDDNVKQILTTCIKSADYLEGIVCSFSLENAGSFKKTMILLCYTLPSVVWAFVRHAIMKSDEVDSPHLRRIHSYSARAFEQCLAILRRRARREVTHTTPWEDVAGLDHLVTSNQRDDASRNVRRREETEESTVRKLQLESERTWTWALCSIFDAYGFLWFDAQSELQGGKHHDDEDIECLSTYSSSLYHESRTTALSDIVASISLLFIRESHAKRPPGQMEANDQMNASPHLPAAILPAAAKIALCNLLDRIFLALDCSLNKLVADVAHLDLGTSSSTRSLALVEALSCAGVWVGKVSKNATTTKTTGGLDLSNGVRLWHAAETSFSQGAGSSVYVADALVLRRLPNLVLLAEELEGTLQSFHDTLQNSLPKKSPNKSPNKSPSKSSNKSPSKSSNKSPSRSQNKSPVKSLQGGSTTNGGSAASKNTPESVPCNKALLFDRTKWLQRVKAKLHALEMERSRHDSEMKQSAAALIDAGVYRGNETPSNRKRKRKTAPTAGTSGSSTKGPMMHSNVEGVAASAEKRRRVTTPMSLPRSRNRTVDEWLQKDRDVYDEDAMEDDAFADLEGFIAEG